jgi:DNA polymerase I-like protein with 3'-5' exonuclease and polymerase domains
MIATVREAIAYGPQGAVGDILNMGMLAVWRSGLCQLLLQIHDAILVQYPEDREDEIVPQLVKLIRVPIELANGRTLIIPSEAQVGWNWAKQDDNNPDGLTKYRGNDSRKRTTAAGKLAGLLDRVY